MGRAPGRPEPGTDDMRHSQAGYEVTGIWQIVGETGDRQNDISMPCVEKRHVTGSRRSPALRVGAPGADRLWTPQMARPNRIPVTARALVALDTGGAGTRGGENSTAPGSLTDRRVAARAGLTCSASDPFGSVYSSVC